MKKIPMRRCVVTNTSYPKCDLLRIVKTPNCEIKVDVTGKLNGHGAYIKKDLEVLNIAKKKKTLEKVLGCKIDDFVYLEIERVLNG